MSNESTIGMTPHERLVAAIVDAMRANPKEDPIAVARRISAKPEHEYADARWVAYTLVDDYDVKANPEKLSEWLDAAQMA